MKFRWLGVFMSVVLLAACAQPAPEKTTMRVCDASGCSDRPVDSATYEPSGSAPDPEAEARLEALEAAARENAAAAYDLGLRYFRGDGVRQDSYQALQWMREAAERGDLEAQKALGRFYLSGLQEMGPDPREAQRWLGAAAAQGDEEAEELLEQANAAREEAAAAYEARRKAWRYYWYYGARYRWYWR